MRRDLLEAMRARPVNVAQPRAHGVRRRCPRARHDGGRGHRVLRRCARRAGAARDPRAAARSSHHSSPAAQRQSPRRRLAEAARAARSPRRPLRAPSGRDRDVARCPGRAKISQLRRTVGLEAAVAVEVVGARGSAAPPPRGANATRVLELERGGLADDRRAVASHRCPTEPAQRARRRCRRPRPARPACAVDVPDQLGGRRLAVCAGHGDELVREQPPGELELAEHRDAARARAATIERRLRRDTGLLTTRAARASSERQLPLRCSSTPAADEPRAPRRRVAQSAPITCSPRSRSASAAASPSAPARRRGRARGQRRARLTRVVALASRS